MDRDEILKKIIIIDKGLYHQDSNLKKSSNGYLHGIKIFTKKEESLLNNTKIASQKLCYWVKAKYIIEDEEGDYVFNENSIITDKTIDIHFENILK